MQWYKKLLELWCLPLHIINQSISQVYSKIWHHKCWNKAVCSNPFTAKPVTRLTQQQQWLINHTIYHTKHQLTVPRSSGWNKTPYIIN